MYRFTTALFILLAACACENKREPAVAHPTKTPALAQRESIDQPPELETRPRAKEETAQSRRATIEVQRSADTPLALERLNDLKNENPTPPITPVAKDGFIATANHACPIMQKMKLNASTAVEHTVHFEGKVIGFCCEDCLDAWDSMNDDERRSLLATVIKKQ